MCLCATILVFSLSYQSYHCQAPHRLAATKMDPSCAFGIYCRNKEDFKQFCIEAERVSARKSYKLYCE